MDTRAIPSTGEQLPVIGCGTWKAFDVAPDGASVEQLTGVLRALFDAGGSMVDSSPMYGRAESVVGKCLSTLKPPDRAFVATKVWTRGRQAGIEEMRRSLALLATSRLDLMQIHNLLDWRTHLATLRDWKAEGTIRYLGITHYTASAHADLAAVIRTEPLDFLQVNYSLEEPEAARELLPLAADRGVAVIVNRPFGGGALVRRLRGRALPDWAAEFGCRTWSQLLLKYVLAHPAVTCVIPGTGSPQHMAEDGAAGLAPFVDPKRLHGAV
jgi:aryl-alcohol dehydrogenase-like predicted oxidoreductase